MRPAHATVLLAMLVLVCVGAGCSTTDEALPTYWPCRANTQCDLGTICTTVPSVMDASAAAICTQSCGNDNDCPGLDALCVLTGGADSGVCYRSCEPGCRPGTTCVQSAAGGRGACMP